VSPREQVMRASVRVHAAARGAVIEPRRALTRSATRVQSAGRAAVLERARALVAQSRAPREHLDRHRLRLHQLAREMRAATRRGRALRVEFLRRIAAAVISRRRDASLRAVSDGRITVRVRGRSIERASGRVEESGARLAASAAALERAGRALEARRAEALATRAAALRAHDPERTLERGYALVLDDGGEPLTGVAALRVAGRFDVRLADGTVGAQVLDGKDTEEADER
jgi:exodeoxyribonuclease VII large subunit